MAPIPILVNVTSKLFNQVHGNAESYTRDGDDGPWSTFDLRVGTPGQNVRVLPSIAGFATWVVLPEGCPTPPTTCANERGRLFNVNGSTSRTTIGNYTLEPEHNFGLNVSGTFGTDTLALGLSNATNGPTLESQIVFGIATDGYRVGMFSLGNQPLYVSNNTGNHTSFLTTLKAQGLIPSLSWAYTAGAHYCKFLTILGSQNHDLYSSSPMPISFSIPSCKLSLLCSESR